ncbi:hypothetical protein EVAR_100824_1 [Eumeta japonica]|uniref:Uncharacterized protein n=1 Tax=Eumeta variegata TaxID=151549 RepID=A0A4C2AHN2_EUMVA|nr:hypothetical protein EVAR_100824_1 [Eumeta japonica]
MTLEEQKQQRANTKKSITRIKNQIEANEEGKGRIVVKFPFKESLIPWVFEKYGSKRFCIPKRRFVLDIVLNSQYVAFMKEYED